MRLARITIFAGHFGSGKTSLAVAYALWAKQRQNRVALCDLDIVNPYFRTSDAANALAQAGVQLIASRFANTNVDAPALPPETRTLFDEPELTGVIDLGGDDRGALALGRYAKLLSESGDYEMLLVLNQYRPLTRKLEDLREIKQEIEGAGKVPFTGLVNNSNLGSETECGDVLASAPFAQEAAAQLGLPLKMTSVDRRLLATGKNSLASMGEIFPLDLYKKQNWKL